MIIFHISKHNKNKITSSYMLTFYLIHEQTIDVNQAPLALPHPTGVSFIHP